MRREEIKLRKEGRFSRALVLQKQALDQSRLQLTNLRSEACEQEERVKQLDEEYHQALRRALK